MSTLQGAIRATSENSTLLPANYRFRGKRRARDTVLFGNMRSMVSFRGKEILRSRGKGTVRKELPAVLQVTPALEVKVERASLTRDARKWQAVIKSGERELRRVPRRSEKRLSCSRPDLVAVGTSFGFRR